MAFKLRYYQDDAVNGSRFKLRSVSALLLVSGTGTGKTVIFSYMAKSAAEKGKRVLILAHRDQLIKQASAKLRDYNLDHGIIMAGFTPALYKPVQLASVQTLVRRVHNMIKRGIVFDLIVIDEAHLSAAKSYKTIVEAFVAANPKVKLLGVTGSPTRLDGRGLGRDAGGLYDDMLVVVQPNQMMEEGFLVRPVVYASKERMDFSHIKKVAGDYEKRALSEMMDKPVITGDAIKEYQRICPGVPAVAWCTNVEHAKNVAKQFSESGIPAVALSGEDSSNERDKALADLASGKIKVITFAMLLVEGVDCPAIGAVILLRPTMSLAAYLQVIGRGLRPIYADGFDLETVEGRFAAMDAGPKGRHCFVIDHAGLTFKHGFADQDREWSLECEVRKKGKRDRSEPTLDLRQCDKCHIVHIPAPTCPACGYIYPPSALRQVEHVEGELERITPEMQAQIALDNRRKQGSARSVDEMVRQLGYSVERAKKIVQAREAKEAAQKSLIADLEQWRNETGQAALDVIGVPLMGIKQLKPKALREMREKFENHKAAFVPGSIHSRQQATIFE